jgi:shikimate dehydrogenase
LQALGSPGAYVPLHITPDKLGEAVQRFRTLGFRGVNVTIPHKVAVMDYLDKLDASAVDVGAVNTIVNDNGCLTGYNTDGIGYVRSLKAEAIADLSGVRILVIGAGGAARGIVSALLQEQPASILIANRTCRQSTSAGGQLPERYGSRNTGMGSGFPSSSADMDVVINTTSVGCIPMWRICP